MLRVWFRKSIYFELAWSSQTRIDGIWFDFYLSYALEGISCEKLIESVLNHTIGRVCMKIYDLKNGFVNQTCGTRVRKK